MKKVCSQNPPFRILKDPIIYFYPFFTSGSKRHTCPGNILTSMRVCRYNSNSQPNYSHSRLRIYVPENIASNFYTVCNIVLFPLSPFCEYLREIVFKVKNANFNAFENSHNIFTTVHTVFSSTHKFFICCVKNLARSWNCLCRLTLRLKCCLGPGARAGVV